MDKNKSKATITRVEFTVADRLVIADPCYIDTDDGPVDDNLAHGILSRSGGGVVLNECEGTWVAEIEISDEGSWGNRTSKLILIRKGESHRSVGCESHGCNGVDSGQMGAFCASNLPLDYDALLAAYGDDFSRHMLAFGGGAVSSTGFGDGCYPVTIERDVDERPVMVSVEFIGDEEDL